AVPATSRRASGGTTSKACSCISQKSATSVCPSNGEGGERELAADPGGGATARVRAATVATTLVRRGRVARRRRVALRRDRRLLRAPVGRGRQGCRLPPRRDPALPRRVPGRDQPCDRLHGGDVVAQPAEPARDAVTRGRVRRRRGAVRAG